MKKIIAMLLVLCLACSLFVACGGAGETEDTTTTTTTTTKRTEKEENSDPGYTVRDDVILLTESESEWKYHVVEVIYADNTYVSRTTDGFGDFVTANPNWMAPDFDDSDWGSKAAPFGDRISQANADAIGWTGDNHGLFLRTTFTIEQAQIDEIKNGEAKLYAWTWYDNTCYMYLNGTEIFAHDDSELFAEGVTGEASGAHDWNDAYSAIDFVEGTDYFTYVGNIADILVAGENTFAISLCDCWGGREFDFGLSVGYDY